MMTVMGCTPHPKKPAECSKKTWSGSPLKGPKPPTAEKCAPEYATWKMTPPKPGDSKEMQKEGHMYY